MNQRSVPTIERIRIEVVKEVEPLGMVLVTAKIENLADLVNADQGTIPGPEVRVFEVDDALVDAGATGLSMPRRLIQDLGLKPLLKRQAKTSAGIVTVQVYGTARLTIQGRDCFTDVTELPDERPVLIGLVPLEVLDFVVDPPNRRQIGNPEHGGEQMIEMY